MSSLPEVELLRRQDLVECLGMSKREIEKMVDAGVLRTFRKKDEDGEEYGWRYFYRRQVEKVFGLRKEGE